MKDWLLSYGYFDEETKRYIIRIGRKTFVARNITEAKVQAEEYIKSKEHMLKYSGLEDSKWIKDEQAIYTKIAFNRKLNPLPITVPRKEESYMYFARLGLAKEDEKINSVDYDDLVDLYNKFKSKK